MNAELVAATIVRTDLEFFIRRAFMSICPGIPYLPNWHVEAIVHQLMNVEAGHCGRLIINQPPRSLKSICIAVAYVAWKLVPTRYASRRTRCSGCSRLKSTSRL